MFLLAGSILKLEAFEAHQASAGPCQKENWDAALRMSSKQFAFWSLVMDLQMLQCHFVRSLREGDFDLYVQVIDELCGWLFIFDQTHYSWWLPIHVKDMVELEKKHPHVLEEFRKGNFVVQKSEKKISLIPKDHSHELTTKLYKSASGVANLFDMPYTMDEQAKLQAVATFEDAADSGATAHHLGHHEEGHSLQMRFAKDVLSVRCSATEKPVLTTQWSGFGHAPYSRGHAICNCADTLQCVQQRQGSPWRLRWWPSEERRVAITDTIKRSALQTFARRTDDTKNNSKVIALRKDISLVSTLFLSLQSRPDFELDNFFKYDNQKEPPSLSDQGKLRSGTKSDAPPDDVTVKVLDGPAVVHMVRPTYGRNYQQYVVRHFMPFITNSLTNSTSRLDIIWDIYPDHNLRQNEATPA